VEEICNTIKKGISEAGRKMEKEEIPQRNSWFDEECQIILEDKKIAYNKMINGNKRQHKMFRQKKIVLFKSKLKHLEIADNNSEAKTFCQAVIV
jgi:hypothetical protein